MFAKSLTMRGIYLLTKEKSSDLTNPARQKKSRFFKVEINSESFRFPLSVSTFSLALYANSGGDKYFRICLYTIQP